MLMDDKTFVHVFIPYSVKNGEPESPDYDTFATRTELEAALNSLSVRWKWRAITFNNLEDAVREVASSQPTDKSVVLNFCDGDEINGFPGISVVRGLESAGVAFTGADSHFFRITTSKILMKEGFGKARVSTPSYRVINDTKNDVAGLCSLLGAPLIVKPAISAASWGITLRSIVYTDEEISVQADELLKGRHGCIFPEGTIFVERFIDGPEFTVLVVGPSLIPGGVKVYPPVERVFEDGLPMAERLLSYERYWGDYDEEPPLPAGTALYTYGLVEDEGLKERIIDLAKRAYMAVGGCGYGRVDIRMEERTGGLFVLEVNANCGISSDDQTSVGQILRLSGNTYTYLLKDILSDAMMRQKATGAIEP